MYPAFLVAWLFCCLSFFLAMLPGNKVACIFCCLAFLFPAFFVARQVRVNEVYIYLPSFLHWLVPAYSFLLHVCLLTTLLFLSFLPVLCWFYIKAESSFGCKNGFKQVPKKILSFYPSQNKELFLLSKMCILCQGQSYGARGLVCLLRPLYTIKNNNTSPMSNINSRTHLYRPTLRSRSLFPFCHYPGEPACVPLSRCEAVRLGRGNAVTTVINIHGSMFIRLTLPQSYLILLQLE